MVERVRYALPLALGGNFTGYAEGAEGQYYNPAGLCFKDGITLIPDFYNYNNGTTAGKNQQQFISGSFSKRKIGAISFGAYNYPNYRYTPDPYTRFNYSQQQFSLDYSRKILKWLASGISVYYIPVKKSALAAGDKINPVSFGISSLAKYNLNNKNIFGMGFSIKTLAPYPFHELDITGPSTSLIIDKYNPYFTVGVSYEYKYLDTTKNGLARIPIQFLFCSDYKNILYENYNNDLRNHYSQTGIGGRISIFRIFDIISSYNLQWNRREDYYAGYETEKQQDVRLGLGINVMNTFFSGFQIEKYKIGFNIFFKEKNFNNRSFSWYDIESKKHTLSLKFEYYFREEKKSD